MRTTFLTLTALTLAATTAAADGHANGLTGATVVITNTFQGAQTEGAEVDVSAFDLPSALATYHLVHPWRANQSHSDFHSET